VFDALWACELSQARASEDVNQHESCELSPVSGALKNEVIKAKVGPKVIDCCLEVGRVGVPGQWHDAALIRFHLFLFLIIINKHKLMQKQSLPEVEEGWVSWFLNRTGGKAEHHHYLTSLMTDHDELYKTPHQQKMFSDSYKNAQKVSKHYCSDIFMLKWKKKNEDKFDGPLT
jgi:hypothetical protein